MFTITVGFTNNYNHHHSKIMYNCVIANKASWDLNISYYAMCIQIHHFHNLKVYLFI